MTTQPTHDRCRTQSVRAAFGLGVALGLSPGSALSQTPAPQTPAAQASAPKEQAPKETAKVPTSHANIHMSSGSGSELLVIVPRGTLLPIIGRKGEWVQVRLTPELRKTSMVMRWYKNEDNGWMHDSTVEISPIKEK